MPHNNTFAGEQAATCECCGAKSEHSTMSTCVQVAGYRDGVSLARVWLHEVPGGRGIRLGLDA
jgi:hypothetical protein